MIDKKLGNCSCLASEKPNPWSKWVSLAEFSYNTFCYVRIQPSPFKVFYGKDILTIIINGALKSPLDDLEIHLQERDDILALKENLNHAQSSMKSVDLGTPRLCSRVSGRKKTEVRTELKD